MSSPVQHWEVLPRRGPVSAPVVDPIALLGADVCSDKFLFERRDRSETVVGFGEAYVVEASGDDRFAAVKRQAARIYQEADLQVPMFGGCTFESEGPARFVIPRWLYRVRNREAMLTLTLSGRENHDQVSAERRRILAALERPEPIPTAPAVTRVDRSDDHLGVVQTAVDLIRAGGLEKVVLSRRIGVAAERSFHPSTVLAGLAHEQGSVRFALVSGGRFFAGATPELLVQKEGRTARSEALAGSATETEALETQKEQSEHAYVSRFVEATLLPFAEEVRVGAAAPSALAHVTHLRTPIEARLAEEVHVLDLVEALHPTPAVGGVPRESAIELIADLESRPRSWYAAPVGWFDARGDGELYVALRSAAFDGRHAAIHVGGGIVADSIPEAEVRETEVKAKTIGTALGMGSFEDVA